MIPHAAQAAVETNWRNASQRLSAVIARARRARPLAPAIVRCDRPALRPSWYTTIFARASSPPPRRTLPPSPGVRYAFRSVPLALDCICRLTFSSVPGARLVAQATGTITGTVLATGSEAPIVSAQIAAQGTNRLTLSDVNGRFRLTGLPAGDVVLEVRRVGFRPMTQRVAVGHGRCADHAQRSADRAECARRHGPSGRRREAGDRQLDVHDRRRRPGASRGCRNSFEWSHQRSRAWRRRHGRNGTSRRGHRNQHPRSFDALAVAAAADLHRRRARFERRRNRTASSRAATSSRDSTTSRPKTSSRSRSSRVQRRRTLYGTEAANGVIQIITKKGGWRRAAFQRVHAPGNAVVPERREPHGDELRQGRERQRSYRGTPCKQEAARGTPLFKTGRLQTYEMNLRGGERALNYYLSSTYDHDTGIEPNNRVGRFTGHANLTIAPRREVRHRRRACI